MSCLSAIIYKERSIFTMNLKIETQPNEQDVRFLDNRINQFNIAKTGIEFGGELAIFEQDEAGAIIAGLYGFT